ncbi:hypothetical protein D554_1550 [Bordetella holmesii 30539]|uniref:N-acetyltransferase YedL n=1 Tax=Bordetella holmesii 1058 TaxID=1247648 RepID=A0ABP3BN14_9BORD|nr:hypothetical protein D560_2098 [Bordetella holmesii ATCC 51541]EWM43228.1 hypothetical protein D556_2089 [Bordetella holmesii 41130]EWM47331.1 hypothetical protein D555_2117 [Bordetella holmesii 35009]EWM51487.1 hypothetical protein D557_1343 [Bordetella holmesii 70147]EXF88736.1 hypothetical protein D554_1550 [Bordetella holmesii 30539]EXX96559.1 hypothetical protein D559_0188 [Bordetella holmesii 1058]KAK96268.1 hypothetical protein L499_A3716 [Bordetella holmesii CDC-H635-BH]
MRNVCEPDRSSARQRHIICRLLRAVCVTAAGLASDQALLNAQAG